MRVQDINYPIVSDKVFVLNKRGKPLEPAHQKRANDLLEGGKAHVVSRAPFIIQLHVATGEARRKITLKIDSGYDYIGFSVVADDGEELLSGIVELDNGVVKRLLERKMYRRNKRNGLWYREPRWQNRTKPEGWLPPSVQRRYDTHLNLIDFIRTLIPIDIVIIETATFDIQKINNPNIEGTDYQKGPMSEYQNMRSYLLAREQGNCQLCKKDFKGQKVHIHHCKQKKDAGSNRPENLAPLHEKCHNKLHNQGLKLPGAKSYKSETFMNVLSSRIQKDLPGVVIAYGYETQMHRIGAGLAKSHYNDAYCIGGIVGYKSVRRRPFVVVQRRRHNRSTQLNRKGYKPSYKTHIYKIQPQDLVWSEGKKYKVCGVHNKGKTVQTIDKKEIGIKKIERVYTMRGMIWE